MRPSPEEYLASVAFDAPLPGERAQPLNYGERIFIEKYLGMELLEKTPEAPLLPVKVLDPPKIIEVSRRGEAERLQAPAPQIVAAPVAEKPAPAVTIAVSEAPLPETPVVAEKVEAPVVTATPPAAEVSVEAPEPEAQPAVEARLASEAKIVSLKERLKAEADIQMVSFFIANQTFLIPIAAIQEVLRHMELVKVPQAPEFVAGAINLRGAVIPLVHLSALLTNEEAAAYTERNFIIVCGNEGSRLGLIIDRISGMHILPQNKLIWNAETKLGDAAEFLYAIADLDDKVCGVVDPDTIAQKILSPGQGQEGMAKFAYPGI